jgi:hypothetical protein
MSLGQQSQRLHQSQLLAPSAEAHVSFLLEQPLDSSFAGGCKLAKVAERPLIRRVGQEQVCDSAGPWVDRAGELQGDRLNGVQLVHY